ncbi:MAG: ferrochelatase, partial [Symbiobacteriaceae bacterium]
AVVLSYHGIPQAYAESGDDYPAQCALTTEAIRARFPELKIVMGYQSKFGSDPWLEPATDDVLRDLARTGHKRVAILAPGFAADCIETLHELVVECAEEFEKAGGEQYDYLPAPNDHPLFIDCLEDLVRQYIP